MILIYNTRLNWLDGKNRISIVFRGSERTFYLPHGRRSKPKDFTLKLLKMPEPLKAKRLT